MKQKGFAPLLIVILLSVVGIIGAYYLGAKKGNIFPISTQTPLPVITDSLIQLTPTIKPTADPTTNWKTYTNNYWKISFKYPDSQLRPCLNYTTEKEGIRFWGPDFGCPDGHDLFYKIGFVGYDLGKYVESKKPSKSETIYLDGKQALKKTFLYNESDGPLYGLKQSVSIVLSMTNGMIVMEQLGDNAGEQRLFDQILSTFKFIR